MNVSSTIYYVLLTLYAALWATVFAAGAFFVALLLESGHILQFEDWAQLQIPFGAILGILFAIWTRRSRILHMGSISLGVVAALWLYVESQRLGSLAMLNSNRGPLSGLAEAIASYLALAYSLVALVVAASGIVGTLMRWHSQRSSSTAASADTNLQEP